MTSKQKQKDINILIALLVVLFVINYPFLDNAVKNFLNTDEEVFVERIIDGDTIVAENVNESIRLLGINTPEKGEFLYQEAKEFLESRVLNETVTLKYGKDRYDKYDRTLAYIFLNNKNINLELVENGFANYYFPSGKDIYYDKFVNAWKICIDKNVNLCEKSDNQCASCIELEDSETLINSCSFSCDITDWKIKAEGRTNVFFSEKILESGGKIKFKLNLTQAGDTIFVRDDERKLVLWQTTDNL